MKNLIFTRKMLLPFFVLLFSAGMVSATTFTVTSTVDGAAGSLRTLVAGAVAGDDIVFDAATNGIPQVLTLGEITISQNILFTGNGAGVTIISGGNASRIFNITGGNTEFVALTLQDGLATSGGAIYLNGANLEMTDVSLLDNEATGATATEGGGAIFNDGGTITLTDTDFINNDATGASGSGGAIFNGPNGALSAKRGNFNGNSAQRAGGALEDNSGAGTTISLLSVTMDSNLALASPGNGGAIHISGAGNLVTRFCTFTNNYADNEGGALWNGTGNMKIARSTVIDGNRASGGAADNGGGGIFNDGGTLNVRRSTIRNNIADGAAGSGGGIFNDVGGVLNVFSSTLDGNTASRAGGGIEDNSGTGGSLNLSQVTVTNNLTGSSPGNGGGLHITGPGDAIISNSQFSGNTAAAEGGGLWNGTGTMIINDVQVTQNRASGAAADQGGGGIFNAGGTLSIRGSLIAVNTADGAAGSGGGILNDAMGSVSLIGVTISSNTSIRAGGGIEDNSGNLSALSIEDCFIEANTTGGAPGNGGGIHITGNGGAIIKGGTVNSNTAASEGGGLWNGTGIMIINGTQIGDNRAQGDAADNGGGGVFNAGGTVRITDGEFIGNNATGLAGSGGGIFNDVGGALKVINSTLRQNGATRAGGGIEDNSGSGTNVNLLNVALNNNTTGNSPGNGGGLHVTGNGTVIITGGTVNNNNAQSEGGGLWNGTGTMSVNGTAIQGNFAFGDNADNGGGGIFNAGGTVDVRDLTISANGAIGVAGSGGGIFNDAGGMLNLLRTTIASNVATRAGGGIEDNSGSATNIQLQQVILSTNTTGSSPGNGGGLHITGPGNATLVDCNVNTNAATAEGGGLWNGTGTMTIFNTNIIGNIAAGAAADQGGGGVFNAGGTVTIDNGTINSNQAAGTAGSGGGVFNDVGGTINITGTAIQGNSATRAGGGIEDNSGAGLTLFLRNVNLDNNTTGNAPGNGGGLHITGPGDAEIRGGTVNNNTAASEGGGLWNGTGSMRVVNTQIDGNTANGDNADNGGGGLFNAGGSLNVRDCSVTNNAAPGISGSGGGIFNDNGGSLKVFRSNISDNTASRAGGGIEDNSGTGNIDLNRVTINDNDAGTNPGNGGGLHITGGADSRITDSEIFFNDAASQGGGLWNGTGRMRITRSAVDDNASNGTNPLTEGGGGLYNAGGQVIMFMSTFSNNIANTATGGNVLNVNGDVIISSATVVEGTALNGGGVVQNGGNTTFSNSIVALNGATGVGGDVINVGGLFFSDDYNFIGADDLLGSFAAVAQANDQVGTLAGPIDPNLGPLQNNGGLTFTHAILCPSPVLDMGNPAFMNLDQRNLPVFNGRRDIGAFESQTGCPDPLVDTEIENLLDFGGEVSTSSVYPNPVTGGRTNVQIPEALGDEVMIRVTDMSGTLIMEQQAYPGTEQMDFARLPKGTYLLQVISDTTTETHRLIVN